MLAKVEIINGTKKLIPITEKDGNGSVLSLDAFYPIGYVYTQYPQQLSPAELFPTFTWTELNLDSAFFRASGGNADAFISSGTLTPQSQSTAKNGLKITKTGGISTGHVYAYDSAVDCYHTHAVYLANGYVGGSYNYRGTLGAFGPYSTNPLDAGATWPSNFPHSHTYTFTPSVSDNIAGTLTSSDTETRPTNYTIKIWARTA